MLHTVPEVRHLRAAEGVRAGACSVSIGTRRFRSKDYYVPAIIDICEGDWCWISRHSDLRTHSADGTHLVSRWHTPTQQMAHTTQIRSC